MGETITTEELFGQTGKKKTITTQELFGEEQKPSLLQSIGQGTYRTAQNIGQVYPAVETGLNLLTSMYGVPLSGLAGLAGLPFGKGPEAVEAVQKATIYQPQTQRGQELTGATTYPLQKLGELSESAAETTTKLAGPEVGTAVGTAIQALPLLIGGLKPTGGKVLTADQLAIIKAVEKYKIPLAPKGYVPSFASKAYQIVTDYFPTGRFWASIKRNQIPDAIMRMMDDVFGELKGFREPTETIRTEAQKGISSVTETLSKTAREGYKAFGPELKKIGERKETVHKIKGDILEDFGIEREPVESRVRIPMPETIKFMEAEKMGLPTTMRSFFNDFSIKKRGREWDLQALDLFQSEAYSKLKGYKTTYYDLMETMKKDIKNWDSEIGAKAVEFLEQGKKNFREAAILEENPIVKNFLGMDKFTQPSMRMGLSRATVEEGLAVKKAVSSNTWDLMRTNLIQELTDSATSKGPEGINNVFAPGVFADNFFKLEPKIKALYPEEYPIWRDLANTMRVAAQDLSKAQKGEGWWMGNAILGGLTYWQPVFVIPAGFSFMVSKSLMNPKGWLRKWVEGNRPAKLPGSLKVGMGIAGASETTQFKNRPYITIRGERQTEPEVEY